MTVDQIRYFLEVARSGSMLEASKRLYITQPTLSRQMAGMEQELNVILFLRTRHGVRLTPAGQTLYDRWSTVTKLYEESVREAVLAFQGMTETLSIGVLDGLKIDSYLPDFLAWLQEKHPNVHLELRRLSFAELVEGLSTGDLELAFSLDVNFYCHPELSMMNIKPYMPAIVVPARHSLARKEHLTISDLREETLVIVNREECEPGVDVIIDACRREGGFIPHLHYVPSMANVLLWLESGLRCAILNMEMSLNDSSTARIIPLENRNSTFVQMAWAQNSRKNSVRLAKQYFAGR